MAKEHKIGPISFSPEGYNKFTSLTKEEQIEKVYNSLSPKDRKLAENLLTHIPHGTGIDGRNGQEAQEDNRTNATGGNGGHNPEQSEATEERKGDRVHKRGKSGQN